MTAPQGPGVPGCPLGSLSAERPTVPSDPVLPAPPKSAETATRGTSGKLLFVGAGAITGLHELAGSAESIAVAPTDSTDHNTIRQPLRPIACWGTVDSRFAFDSSFIQPDMQADLGELRIVLEKNPDALLSVFGHADPVGAAGYNKLLSGRRAAAVYGALTRKVAIWEQLASTPMGRDRWEPDAFVTMKDALERAGRPAPAAKPALIKAYMDLLCTDKGRTFEVAPARFLGKGADSKGKGDFQGCGEFNPLRILSLEEERRFAGAEQHPERNARNAPNRRVLIFLFPADTAIDVAKWPCPRATEGVSGCRLRLWSDADARVAPAAAVREHPGDETFSCRFYDRLARRSPCEQLRESVAIRLYDDKGREMPGAVFRLSLDGVILQESAADERGAFSVVVPTRKIRALIEWGPKPAKGAARVFTFSDDVCPGANPDNPADIEDCLINLGYSGGSPLPVKVKGFQTDYGPGFGLRPTGVLDPVTLAAIRDVYRSEAANIREHRATQRGGTRGT